MKKTIGLLFIITFCVSILTACGKSADTIQTANGKEYPFAQVTPEDGHFYLGGINLYTAASDELKGVSEYDAPFGASLDLSTPKTVAAAGADILSAVFDAWTQTGIVICHNEIAGAWIIHGQLESRERAADGVGVAVIDIESASVIAIAYGKSAA